MSEPSRGRMWATPRSYSFNKSHAPGLTTLDIQVRGLYPEKERYHGVPTIDSPQLTLFAEAFPVSPTPWLADVAPLRTSATSGPSSPDSFAKYAPDGSWLKTSQGYCQASLDGSLERFSETWPRAGMTRNGIAYLRPPLAPLTDGTGSGLWRTPGAQDGERGVYASEATIESRLGKGGQLSLPNQVKHAHLWPTPCAQEDGKTPEAHLAMKARMKGGPRYTVTSLQVAAKLAHPNNGALNPTWVEWLMGYPIGWTVLEGWATRSSRRSRNG
jgi:hypothetical protein